MRRIRSGYIALLALAAIVAAPRPARPETCNTASCSREYCGYVPGVSYQVIVRESVSCNDGTTLASGCGYFTDSGACIGCYSGFKAGDTCDKCPGGFRPTEDPTNGIDDNQDGCIDEGGTFGTGACSCERKCEHPSCDSPQRATCRVTKRAREICWNGEDDNCDGNVDEGCALPDWGAGGGSGGGGGPPPPPPPPYCPGKTGADPILLFNQSATTEPFTDFSASAVVALDLRRLYSSADWSLWGGPRGAFGRGWHHSWEGKLTCSDGKCVVSRGFDQPRSFVAAELVTSLDGTEQWQLYRTFANEVLSDTHRDLLARRPDGEWILFGADGTEQRFRAVCDACGAADRTCVDPLAGGVARLTSVTDARGNVVHVGYARAQGVLQSMSDDLGHVLELRAGDACGAGLATELRYDGMPVAIYAYDGADLTRAADADGSTLRSYVYHSTGTGFLVAVQNEAGAPIVEFSYDPEWRAIGLTDHASTVSVVYGASGLVEVTEYAGSTASTSQRSFDLHGNVVSVSDGCACGPPKTYTWDDRKLVCEVDALGHATHREYDALRRVIRDTEYSGTCPPPAGGAPAPSRSASYEYGIVRQVAWGVSLELDRVTSESRPSVVGAGTGASSTVAGDYDPTPKAIDPPGYACQAAPLPAGSVVCRQMSSGYVPTASGNLLERHATFFSYDAKGRLVRTVGPMGLDGGAGEVVPVEERTYWADGESLVRRGRLREVKRFPAPDAAPLVTSFDYDAFGIFQARAPDGGLTTLVHDGRGRVQWVIGPDGAATETRFYDGNAPRLVIAASGATTRYAYDSRGRVQLVERLSGDPERPGASPVLGWSELTRYDPAGNPVHVERLDRQGVVTWQRDREFDIHHREVGERHPEVSGVARTLGYDASGLLAATADEEARTTQFVPDALRRVQAVVRSGVDGSGAPAALDVARYAYEGGTALLASVVDGKGQSTSYRHDDFGRLWSLTTPNLKAGTVYFAYDARGNLLQRRAGDVTVAYTYDGIDRILTQVASNAVDGSSVAYTYRYDENGFAGRLTSTVEPERTVWFAYDLAGRLVREWSDEVGRGTLTTIFAYDPDGAVSTIVYPSGLRVDLERDGATREVRAVRNGATGTVYASAIEHLPAGPISDLTFGNGLALTHSFNRRHEPVAVASGPLALDYAMKPAGAVASIAEGATTRSFDYDLLDRLTGSPGWLSFSHDGAGNRTADLVAGTASVLTYAGDRVTARNEGVAYRGCYADSYTRALPVELMSSGATLANCVAAARGQGLRYAGLQFHGYCFGGNTLQYAKVADSECNMPCTASPGEACGGSWRNTVYEVTGTPGTLSFAYDLQSNVSAIAPPAVTVPYGYQGCYVDTSSRALPTVLMSGGATPETCKAAARAQGLAYAGLQYYGWCFGGNTLTAAAAPESDCNTACSADPAQTCGGAWRNSVWGSAAAPAPPTQAACLRHDALGRLVTFGTTLASGVSADGLACETDGALTSTLARFRYDARARRVARWLAATNEWTYVVSDAAGNPLSELVSTGDPASPWRKVRDYVWLDGRPLAQLEYPGPAGAAEGYAYYFHVDHIGLPRALTNSAGQTVWTAEARPYGDVVETAAGDPASGRTVVTNLRLPGQYDERLFAQAGISGLQGPYYNWNRWYLPTVGRYMELDPLALDGEFNSDYGVDWYSYASGDPVGHADQFGLFTMDKTCINLPNEADVLMAADAVTDAKLKQCILKQNEHAHLGCPDKPDPGCCDGDPRLAACAGGPGTCAVTWCNRTKQKCSADVLVHEFAHNCGWKHDGGKGVPHQSGTSPGACVLQ